MNEVCPSSQRQFHEETLFSCFVGKRVRDASIYVSKKYRSSFYSRAIATIATNVTMLQCYMLHVTMFKTPSISINNSTQSYKPLLLNMLQSKSRLPQALHRPQIAHTLHFR